MTYISIPVPEPGKVAFVIGNGTQFAMVHVSKHDLSDNPAGTVTIAMHTMEDGLRKAFQKDLPGWTEVDVVQTERGYVLSPEALDEVMRASFGEQRSFEEIERIASEDPDDRAIREAHGFTFEDDWQDESLLCRNGCGLNYPEISAGKICQCSAKAAP